MAHEKITGALGHLIIAQAALIERVQRKFHEERLAGWGAQVWLQGMAEAAIVILIAAQDGCDTLGGAVVEGGLEDGALQVTGVLVDELRSAGEHGSPCALRIWPETSITQGEGGG